MSDGPDKAASEARGAELRENIALTDARRTEEERAKAEHRAEGGRPRRPRGSRARRSASSSRRPSACTPRPSGSASRPQCASTSRRSQTPPAAAVAGIPGVDRLPPAAQRPEVLVGVAFAGSFLVARILKRIFD